MLQVKPQVAPLHATIPFAGAAGHAPHAPPQQTLPEPHEVRSGTLPLATHVDCPVAQLVVPVWHALATMHATPDVQAVHAPLSHTSLGPHAVPLATLVPVSMHVVVGEQESVPVWQALVGVHAEPWLHAPQVPLLHTWFEPHGVPLGALAPVSVQAGVPVPQVIMPVWQGLVGWHAAPCAHATQAPLSHTSATPHELPFGSIVPVSVHVEAPPVQASVPT